MPVISVLVTVILEVVILLGAAKLLLHFKSKTDIQPIEGFIVIGYQGVGKSSLASSDSRYIDFESSSFKVDGKRTPEWYIYYCNAAVKLAEGGYVVFMSSHKEVRDYFSDYIKMPDHLDVYICYPHPSLQLEWKHKLKKRYIETESDKDYAAWQNAEDRYSSNIKELADTPFFKIIIRSSQYDLYSVFNQLVADHRRPSKI